jgi:hypothetical protein
LWLEKQYVCEIIDQDCHANKSYSSEQRKITRSITSISILPQISGDDQMRQGATDAGQPPQTLAVVGDFRKFDC